MITLKIVLFSCETTLGLDLQQAKGVALGLKEQLHERSVNMGIKQSELRMIAPNDSKIMQVLIQELQTEQNQAVIYILIGFGQTGILGLSQCLQEKITGDQFKYVWFAPNHLEPEGLDTSKLHCIIQPIWYSKLNQKSVSNIFYSMPIDHFSFGLYDLNQLQASPSNFQIAIFLGGSHLNLEALTAWLKNIDFDEAEHICVFNSKYATENNLIQQIHNYLGALKTKPFVHVVNDPKDHEEMLFKIAEQKSNEMCSMHVNGEDIETLSQLYPYFATIIVNVTEHMPKLLIEYLTLEERFHTTYQEEQPVTIHVENALNKPRYETVNLILEQCANRKTRGCCERFLYSIFGSYFESEGYERLSQDVDRSHHPSSGLLAK